MPEKSAGAMTADPHSIASVYAFERTEGASLEELLDRLAGPQTAHAARKFRVACHASCSETVLLQAIRLLHDTLTKIPFSALDDDKSREDAAAVNWFGARVTELEAGLV
ncbi:hypothetical protein [Roseivivax marinus]|uniref:hypothetical protein n=1 Tax=Roseivivax marinus TaxID=1379903 RepID=UPI00273EF3FE|nr:hypothetical protein [Roseivivax marinus]